MQEGAKEVKAFRTKLPHDGRGEGREGRRTRRHATRMIHSRDARGTRGILKSATTATEAAVTSSVTLSESLAYLSGKFDSQHPIFQTFKERQNVHQSARTTAEAFWPSTALS